MTAPTPAAPEPGTGTRDALAAVLAEPGWIRRWPHPRRRAQRRRGRAMREGFRRGPDDGFHVGYGQWVTHADWTTFTSALGYGDDHNEPAATPAEMLPSVREAFDKAHEHIECERMAEEQACRDGECDHDEHPMTAPTPAAPEPGTGTRDALAGVLAEHFACGWMPTEGTYSCGIAVSYGLDMPAQHYAAALAPEVARIEGEAREAERERIAAKIEALLTTTGPKELARIARSRP